MKITVFNSTLSCTTKCIRFVEGMHIKKIVFGLFIITFLQGCSTPTAMLGPAYTFSSTGNVIQAGLNYGSNQMITMYTGKTPIENLQTINLKKKETGNIKKKTLESDDFYFLVKQRVESTSKIIKKSNQ